MHDIHPIRLHGPWQAEVLACFVAPVHVESQRRVTIPSNWRDWLGDSFRGRVAYLRKFGIPTGLVPDQKVWLVVEEVDFCGSIFLNDDRLGEITLGDSPFRIEVQNRIRKFNELRIEVELPIGAHRAERSDVAGGLIGSVRLEIEE